MPANARYLLGVLYPSSEGKKALNTTLPLPGSHILCTTLGFDHVLIELVGYALHWQGMPGMATADMRCITQ